MKKFKVITIVGDIKYSRTIHSLINITPGFLCWICSLLLVHGENNNVLVSGFQAILIGAFVAYFSVFSLPLIC